MGQRLQSTRSSGLRPMILQFHSMHKRRVGCFPRRTFAILTRRLDDSHLASLDRPEKEARDEKFFSISINIVISLPVDASPAEMIHALKQLVSSPTYLPARSGLTIRKLYSCWNEVMRRISARMSQIYGFPNKDTKGPHENFDDTTANLNRTTGLTLYLLLSTYRTASTSFNLPISLTI